MAYGPETIFNPLASLGIWILLGIFVFLVFVGILLFDRWYRERNNGRGGTPSRA